MTLCLAQICQYYNVLLAVDNKHSSRQDRHTSFDQGFSLRYLYSSQPWLSIKPYLCPERHLIPSSLYSALSLTRALYGPWSKVVHYIGKRGHLGHGPCNLEFETPLNIAAEYGSTLICSQICFQSAEKQQLLLGCWIFTLLIQRWMSSLFTAAFSRITETIYHKLKDKII